MNIIITIAITALVVLYAGLYKAKKALLPLTLIGLALSMVFVVLDWNQANTYFNMIQMDNFALAFGSVAIIGTILVFLLTPNYFNSSHHIAEYFTLILLSLCGVIMMVSYTNLSMLFIGVETMSVCLYILAGIRKSNFASNEASLKYFLLGAFSTGFLLFGIALIYGATGSFSLEGIKNHLVNNTTTVSPLFYSGIILMMVGMTFKIGAAPFQFWVPDVYEGSPSLVTTFMITVVKTAGFAALLRLFSTAFAPLHDFWMPALLVMVVVTLFVGNITALYQKNFKRLLAYSSISHAGYMLFALIVLTSSSSNSVLVYAAAYTFANIVAFAVLINVKQKTGSDDIEAFNGLAKRNPMAALALTLALMSLAGIPLTAGFIGKYLMFFNVLEGYQVSLVVIAIINALIGFYYYFKVIIAVYFKEGKEVELTTPFAYKVALVVSSIGILILGLYPGIILGLF